MLQANSRRYFKGGSITGPVNKHPMTPDIAQKLGMVAGTLFRNGGHIGVIGKDTRLSSYMLETALTSGLLAVGLRVLLTGPIPTPGIRMLTTSMRCDLGIMISGKDDPHEINGIMFFGPDGAALSEAHIARIEAELDAGNLKGYYIEPARLGRAKRIDGAQERYVEHVKRTLSGRPSFEGLRVVVDCAHGAAYEVAPKALEELGAEVFALGVDPNGVNINSEIGVGAPHIMVQEVRGRRADLGITLSGDGSEAILADRNGELITSAELKVAFANKKWNDDGLAIALNVLNQIKIKKKPACEILDQWRRPREAAPKAARYHGPQT